MSPYQGDKGSTLLKPIKLSVNKLPPEHTKLEISSRDEKLNSCFSKKGKTSFVHQHELIYYVNCAEPSYRDNYKEKE